jgi:hypothetical protein
MYKDYWISVFENTKQRMMEDYDGPLGEAYEPTDDEVVAEMEGTGAVADAFGSAADLAYEIWKDGK